MKMLSFQNAKVFYDENGQPSEVLISYEAFQKLQALLVKLGEQGYFWTENWQKRIREGEADLEAGRVYRATKENLDAALHWLDK